MDWMDLLGLQQITDAGQKIIPAGWVEKPHWFLLLQAKGPGGPRVLSIPYYNVSFVVCHWK
jgi:hypothetical protein